jgi:tetratricopeptide (TPR) repeat protein
MRQLFQWLSQIARLLRLCLRLIYRVEAMFSEGEKLKQIKLACWVDYAAYFYEKKDFRRAIESYQKALLLDPNSYYANIGLALRIGSK